jgi:hypothetical protein
MYVSVKSKYYALVCTFKVPDKLEWLDTLKYFSTDSIKSISEWNEIEIEQMFHFHKQAHGKKFLITHLGVVIM